MAVVDFAAGSRSYFRAQYRSLRFVARYLGLAG